MVEICEWFMANRDMLHDYDYTSIPVFGPQLPPDHEKNMRINKRFRGTSYEEPPAVKLKEAVFKIVENQPDNQNMVPCLPKPPQKD